MKTRIEEGTISIIEAYDSAEPKATADSLQNLWLSVESKSMAGIKAEQRALQKTAGTPVAALRSIGKEISRVARKRVADFVPLARMLWDEYGREGRVVAVIFLGAMELVEPESIFPLVKELCRSCITWEDADQLAMRALEPIVRKRPEQWLDRLEPWLDDENKWVRRAGVTTIGRLAMKRPSYTTRCVELAERLLFDAETDVKRAVSFALRLSARGETQPVHDLLVRRLPERNPAATWVLCDTIRSMAAKLLPEFASLLPYYRRWAEDPALSAGERRSVESAVKKLSSVN